MKKLIFFAMRRPFKMIIQNLTVYPSTGYDEVPHCWGQTFEEGANKAARVRGKSRIIKSY